MPHGPIIYLPARCNCCGEIVAKAPFTGDFDTAMKSNRKCPACGDGSLYRTDEEDEEEQDITDSCWNYGENTDRESHD